MTRKRFPILESKFNIHYNKNQKELISLKNIQKNFGKKNVLININLDIEKGENIALIGHNGSGKTTLSNIIGRVYTAASGTISYKAENANEIGRMIATQSQTPDFPEGYTVKETLHYFRRMVNKEHQITNEEFDKLVFDIFGMKSFYNKRMTSLSGGQQQRINLVIALLKKPSILIIDELTTGLDAEVYGKAVTFIKEYTADKNVTLILISHKFSEIKKLTDKVILLKDGVVSTTMSTSKFTHNKFSELTFEELISTKKLIESQMYRDWENNFSSKLLRKINEYLFKKFSIKYVPKNHIQVKNIYKTFGRFKALQNVNLSIKRGEKIALIGRNGSGKTTLAEIISKTQKPTLGVTQYWWGTFNSQIKSGIGMQFQQNLFPDDLTVKDVLWMFAGTSHKSWNSNELLQAIETFRLTKLLKSRAGILSGGERQRLNVLIALLKKPELLILDEISTGLDVQSVKQINEFLLNYFKQNNITLILISHNYDEIKNLTEKAYVLEDGKIKKPTYNIKKMQRQEVKKLLVKTISNREVKK